MRAGLWRCAWPVQQNEIRTEADIDYLFIYLFNTCYDSDNQSAEYGIVNIFISILDLCGR